MKGKKGAELLTENVVFIIVTILFIGTLFLFVSRATSTTSQIEQIQAKKLALVIDSARPGTSILLDVEDILKKKSRALSEENVFFINGNSMNVKLSEKSGYSYSFFNDAEVVIGLAEGKPGYIKIIVQEKS